MHNVRLAYESDSKLQLHTPPFPLFDWSDHVVSANDKKRDVLHFMACCFPYKHTLQWKVIM